MSLNSVRVGHKVYDSQGEKVGTVASLDNFAGTMRVETNPFSEQALVLPLGMISSIHPRELFVASTRDDLRRDYAVPTEGLETLPERDVNAR